MAVEAEHVPWSVAWERAAYGAHGFYTTGAAARIGPSAFFRTSVHVGAVFHGAMAGLLLEVDARLDRPAVLDVVDVGAGRGELLEGVLASLPDDVVARLRPYAVDVSSGVEERLRNKDPERMRAFCLAVRHADEEGA